MTVKLTITKAETEAGFVIKEIQDQDLSATRSYLENYSPNTNGPIVEKSDEHILQIVPSTLYPSLFSFDTEPENN
jgi:hypothetical protein